MTIKTVVTVTDGYDSSNGRREKNTLKNGPPGRVGSPPRAGEEGDFVMEGEVGTWR